MLGKPQRPSLNTDGDTMDYIEDILQKSQKYSSRYQTLAQLTTAPEIIAHNSYWRKLIKEQKSLEDIHFKRQKLLDKINEQKTCVDTLRGNIDEQYAALIKVEIEAIEQQIQLIYKDILSMLADGEKLVSQGAAIYIQAKGEHTYKFCKQIFDMYKSFCNHKEWEFAESSVSVLGGIKEGKLQISGEVYFLLSSESAVHRWKDSSNKKCNVLVTVIPLTASKQIEMEEKDIKVDVFHAGGAGGQNVNKVETAIRIRHLPTNIVVNCQDERSQLKNKERALQMLADRVRQRAESERDKQNNLARKEVESYIKANNISRIYDCEKDTVSDSRISYKKSLAATLSGDIEDIMQSIKISEE